MNYNQPTYPDWVAKLETKFVRDVVGDNYSGEE